MALHLERGSFLGLTSPGESFDGVLLREIEHGPEAELPLHVHELPYFCFMLGGELRERCGFQDSICTAGTAIFNPAFVEHSDRVSQKGARCVVAELGADWTRDHLAGVALDTWRSLAGPTAWWVGSRLRMEMQQPDSASSISVAGLLLTAAADLSRTTSRGKTAPRWLERAADRLRDEWMHPPALGALAAEAGVHPAHLARAFRKEFRCTPGEYVRRRRIEWAREQLLAGSRSMSEIAHAAGFADQSHFIRTFKRYTGSTPSAHRPGMTLA